MARALIKKNPKTNDKKGHGTKMSAGDLNGLCKCRRYCFRRSKSGRFDLFQSIFSLIVREFSLF